MVGIAIDEVQHAKHRAGATEFGRKPRRMSPKTTWIWRRKMALKVTKQVSEFVQLEQWVPVQPIVVPRHPCT